MPSISRAAAGAAARTVLALSGVTADGDGPSTKSAEVRLGDVQINGAHLAAEAPSEKEIRLGDVRKPDGTAEDGQVSHEFFGEDGSDRTDPILGGVSDFVPQNLALSEENDRFSAPLELSGNDEEVSGRGSNLHETKSEAGEALHEMKSETGPFLRKLAEVQKAQMPPRRSVGGRKPYRTRKPPMGGTLPRKEQQSGTLYLHRPTVEVQ